MSEPIDFIDLTIDSPVKKALRLRNRNVGNISSNSTSTTATTTKRRKRNVTKQQSMQLNDSVIEISTESTCKNVQSMEIINLDKTDPPDNPGTYCTDDSSEKNVVALSCPICYEQLSSKIKPMSTRCGHIFCANCLERATRKSKKCPTCQRPVKFQNCTRLYF